MPSLTITRKNGDRYVALYDECDVALVEARRWRVNVTPRSTYARSGDEGYMHNLILGVRFIDHINGNGLDNRRMNLRPATKQQNAANKDSLRLSSSRYKGVTLHRGGKWQASIKVDGRSEYLGLHSTQEAAARAYDTAALAAFGVYARLNFGGNDVA